MHNNSLTQTKPKSFMHYVLEVIGWLLFAIGFIIIWTPIPIGMPFLAIGSIILIRQSGEFRRWLRAERQKNAFLNQIFHFLQRQMPGPIAEPLQDTQPETITPVTPPGDKDVRPPN